MVYLVNLFPGGAMGLKSNINEEKRRKRKRWRCDEGPRLFSPWGLCVLYTSDGNTAPLTRSGGREENDTFTMIDSSKTHVRDKHTRLCCYLCEDLHRHYLLSLLSKHWPSQIPYFPNWKWNFFLVSLAGVCNLKCEIIKIYMVISHVIFTTQP